MKQKEVLVHFKDIAERLSCKVIFDKFDGRGGHCIAKGMEYIIINRRLPNVEQVEVFSQALRRLPIENLYILPRVRKYIETD
ncbi:MAG: hypothetical protein E3J87_02400 [Candidatus Cloacimonadota bacterium]|nr:MAG: hypothetical protein E3J87_02400 [Candidatus Cloacimonadota bacterium]